MFVRNYYNTTIAYYSSLPNICFLKYLMDKKDGGYKEKVVQRRE